MRMAILAAAAAAALLSSGCASMARLEVVVQLDVEQIKETGTVPTVEVNLIGINDSELPQWQGYSIDQYWTADDKLRRGADKVVLKFGETSRIIQTLKRDGAVWDTWEEKTARHLFVIADIPGVSGKGGSDGRLLVLPLDPKAWSVDKVTITVKAGGITCTPAPKVVNR
jgi:hypothetical protein